jgi:hypothetical protein
MKKNLTQVAIMALLFSSLGFAGDKDKSTSAATGAQPASAARSEQVADHNTPCVSTGDKKKDKNQAKPAPSDQEEQFNKVLQGIYG